MLIKKIEVKESFDRIPVYIFTVLDTEGVETIDFYRPDKIDKVTLSPNGIFLFLASGDKSVFKVPVMDPNVLDRLAGLVDRAVGPGAGLKLNEYYSNIRDKKK